MKIIAVYGSSRITPADPEYAEAYEVGRRLGAAGYSIMTGGYQGVMEAASRGAAETGAHVIGVTTGAIEALSGNKPNAWVKEEIGYDVFSQRLAHLVHRADGYVAMQGGIGTLHEIVSVWELMRLGEIPHRPLVCYDALWEDALRGLMNNKYVHPDYQRFIHFAHTPQAVLDYLQGFSPETRS
jgi:uncharacterized protein (TIGR00730 family)